MNDKKESEGGKEMGRGARRGEPGFMSGVGSKSGCPGSGQSASSSADLIQRRPDL